MRKLLFSFGVLTLTITNMSAQTLVGHWPFTGNANDASGNGLNGTVHNATLTTDENGTANAAYYFNGTNAHIDITDNNHLLNVSSWTIQAAVEVLGYDTTVSCHAGFIVSRGVIYSDSFYCLYMTDNNIYGNNCSTFKPESTVFEAGPAGSAATYNWNNTNFIELNHWYCVTATYASDTLKVYLDGTLINTGYFPNFYSYGTSDPVLSFGYYNEGGATYPWYFNGKMEEVSIWNGALDASTIAGYCNKAHEGSWKTTDIPQTNIDNNITVSPNPATNTLNVQLPNSDNAVLYIVNEVGQTVLTYKTTKADNAIDISQLPVGFYILKTALNNGNVQTTKFIKN
jgi:hypothetical protein